MKTPCKCWQTVNEKLNALGVKLSEKLRALSPDADLNLNVIHQLPTEPLTGKFKGRMPRYVGFPFCPFCGQPFKSTKEAA